MDKQKKYMLEDLTRTRMAKDLDEHEKRLMYAINADYRIAENPDTARLLVRERHGMLTKLEAKRLADLRANLIELGMMCDSITY